MESSHLAVKLDMDIGLKAEKVGANCVEVKWNRVQAGACYIKHEVVFRNASRSVISSETGYNILEMMNCNLPSNRNITYIDLTVSFKTTSKNFTTEVTETPISTPVPATPGMALFCSFSLVLLCSFIKLYKSRNVLHLISRIVLQLQFRCSVCMSLVQLISFSFCPSPSIISSFPLLFFFTIAYFLSVKYDLVVSLSFSN